jgi:hypothetical protein
MDFTTQRILFNAAGAGGDVTPGYVIYYTSTSVLAQGVSVYMDSGKDKDVYFAIGSVITRWDPEGILDWSVTPSSGWQQTTPISLQSDNYGPYAYNANALELIAISTTGAKRWTEDYYRSGGGNTQESFTYDGVMVTTPGYCGLVMGARPGPGAGTGENQYPIAWYAGIYTSNGGRVFSFNGTQQGTNAWYFSTDANRPDNANIDRFKAAEDKTLPAGMMNVYYGLEVNKLSFFRWTAYTTVLRSAFYISTAANRLSLCGDSSGNAFLSYSVYGGSYYTTQFAKLDTSNSAIWAKYIYIPSQSIEVRNSASDDDYVYFTSSGNSMRIIKVDASTGDLVKVWKITCTEPAFYPSGEGFITLGNDHIYFTLPYLGFVKMLKEDPVLGTFGTFTIEEDTSVIINDTGVSKSAQSTLTTSPPAYGPTSEFGAEYWNNLMQPNSTTIIPQTRGWETTYFE